MKTIPYVLSLMACFVISATFSIAQPSKGTEMMKKERFTVSLKIGPRGQLSDVSFRNTKGKAFKATIFDAKALINLRLAPGTTVRGTFRYGQLSGTDLGSGRVYSGTGTLRFKQVTGPKGEKVGCPPLCENAVRLGVKLEE